MSCPHPRGPVERVVGPRTDIVCPDCHARLEAPEPEPGEEPVEEPVEIEATCLKGSDSGVCLKPLGHNGRHRYEA